VYWVVVVVLGFINVYNCRWWLISDTGWLAGWPAWLRWPGWVLTNADRRLWHLRYDDVNNSCRSRGIVHDVILAARYRAVNDVMARPSVFWSKGEPRRVQAWKVGGGRFRGWLGCLVSPLFKLRLYRPILQSITQPMTRMCSFYKTNCGRGRRFWLGRLFVSLLICYTDIFHICCILIAYSVSMASSEICSFHVQIMRNRPILIDSDCDNLKACPHCRRKVRQSPNFAIVSPFSATVALFCDSVDRALCRLYRYKFYVLFHLLNPHLDIEKYNITS